MFRFIHLFVLISSTLLVESEKFVMKDVVRPKSISVEEHDNQIRNFWTPERLAKATEFRLVLPKNATRKPTASSKTATVTGPRISFLGSLSTLSGTSNTTAPTNVFNKTTGRVFWTAGIYLYSCSGSVVQSASGDLITTAAHCVYDTSSGTLFLNNSWVFIPAYDRGVAPYGIWPARRMLVGDSWRQRTDMNADVAFVAVSTLNNVSIQAYVGSQGIGFNYPRLAYTIALGYPGNILNGMVMQRCVGFAQRSRWIFNGYIGQGLSCNMGGGSSGGPWIQNMNSTGLGFVTSVNSFTISTIRNVMNGPYFSSMTAALYANATTM